MSILDPLLKALEFVNQLNAKYFALSYEEQKAMTFLERLQAYNWTFELVVVAILVLMYVFYVGGTKLNTRRASKLFGAINESFHELAFAKVGFSTKGGQKKQFISEQNNTWFTSFTTGRSAIESITVQSHMYAHYNPIAMLVERLLAVFFPALVERDLKEFVDICVMPNGIYASTETGEASKNADEVLSNFKFVTAVVNKSDMAKVREENYYLSITHTAENDKLPVQYVFMSENNQLNGLIPHYGGSRLHELLEKVGHFLTFISFTDLPEEKPVSDKLWEKAQKPRCVIRCKLQTNAADLKLLQELISCVVGMYDTMTREYVQGTAAPYLSKDLLKKSHQLRSQELQKIQKVMKQVERELAIEKKQKLEKEKRREQRSRLSGEEQDKLDKKMREKRERRQRNKQKTRM
ncbi:LAMI_0D07954g1_1 [Lachancea mirantina]|uniref:LAMI_0D07954g1_1 n=1 Tax=Lachancea mirantina TaxID=1230905 RepID=A0A1G4JCM1_9SACH|nr:LAMI_0D07954g1_1 [Lachancea mirantina]